MSSRDSFGTTSDGLMAPTRPPRRRWKRVLLTVAACFAGLVVLGVVVIALVNHHLNTPASVPSSFRAPSSLPRSPTAPITKGDLVFDSNRTGNYEIFTMNATGGDVRQMTHNAKYDSWWARISPNRQTILFYRTPKGVHDRDFSKTSLWVMAANGTHKEELRPAGLDGWVIQGHAEWSPDGKRLVMTGGSRVNPQIWTTNELGGDPRAVTHRGGSNLDPSWAPDGKSIVFIGCPSSFCLPSSREVYTISASGHGATRITHDKLQDNDPYFSNSGTELAWLTKMTGGALSVGTWNIRIVPVVEDGSRIAAVSGTTPRVLVPDGNKEIDSKPSWSLNDQTIYFHRATGDFKHGYQIWAISPNGTDLREITKGQPGSNEYPGT
jgi:Tol biopolymer transport system component